MRLWHYKLIPYLPKLQFDGQLREIVAIMRAWRDDGETNHLLINKVMEYPNEELTVYYMIYESEYAKRYMKFPKGYMDEFTKFCSNFPLYRKNEAIFKNWHNKEYLRICMANLYEKYYFGIGKSRITDDEWLKLCEGYKNITGEEYKI